MDDSTKQHAKLTNVEAQRIMAILSETHSKLQLLAHVPPLDGFPTLRPSRTMLAWR